jgi:hypothetical protein
MEQFLNKLKQTELSYKDWVIDLDVLEASRKFRAEYADHPQYRALQNWLSYSDEDHQYHHIIYFTPRDPGESEPQMWTGPFERDPSSPNFRMPVECEHYYATPSTEKTYDALQRVVIAALGSGANGKSLLEWILS